MKNRVAFERRGHGEAVIHGAKDFGDSERPGKFGTEFRREDGIMGVGVMGEVSGVNIDFGASFKSDARVFLVKVRFSRVESGLSCSVCGRSHAVKNFGEVFRISVGSGRQ